MGREGQKKKKKKGTRRAEQKRKNWEIKARTRIKKIHGMKYTTNEV